MHNLILKLLVIWEYWRNSQSLVWGTKLSLRQTASLKLENWIPTLKIDSHFIAILCAKKPVIFILQSYVFSGHFLNFAEIHTLLRQLTTVEIVKPPLACYAVVRLLDCEVVGLTPHPRTFYQWRCLMPPDFWTTWRSRWIQDFKGSVVDIQIRWLFQGSQQQWFWYNRFGCSNWSLFWCCIFSLFLLSTCNISCNLRLGKIF